MYIPILSPISQVLKLGSGKSSKFVLFQNCFGFLVPLHFNLNLELTLTLKENIFWDLIGNALNPVQFEMIYISYLLSYSTLIMI